MEPLIPSDKSKAREALHEDILSGKVPLEEEQGGLSTEDIYNMHQIYAKYNDQKFAKQLESLHGIVQSQFYWKEIDENAF